MLKFSGGKRCGLVARSIFGRPRGAERRFLARPSRCSLCAHRRDASASSSKAGLLAEYLELELVERKAN
jgi:hypothetical protein